MVWLTLPLWRHWCRRTGHVDDPGHRKIHDAPIALAGGPAVLTGVLAPLLVGAILLKLGIVSIASTGLIVHGVDRRALELGVIGLGAVAITLLGWFDDRVELGPLVKFAGQFLIAFAVALVAKRITLFVPNEFFSYAITVFWIVTVINAFNFMDNMNGLCTGLGVIGALLFGLIAARDGEYLVALIAFLTAGFPALQLSPGHRLSGRCRQPPGGLSAGGAGHSAAFLYENQSASPGGRFPAARAGGAAGGPRLHGGHSHPCRPAVLDWRHQSSFPPPGARRPDPRPGRAGHLGAGGGDWFTGAGPLERIILEIAESQSCITRIMDMFIQRPRVLEAIRQALKRSPVAALLGARQCGKTTLAHELTGADRHFLTWKARWIVRLLPWRRSAHWLPCAAW